MIFMNSFYLIAEIYKCLYFKGFVVVIAVNPVGLTLLASTFLI